MKWRIKEAPTPPKGGERRTRRVFAWKPQKVGRFKVWLASFEVTEEFFQPVGGGQGWWSETRRDICVYY